MMCAVHRHCLHRYCLLGSPGMRGPDAGGGSWLLVPVSSLQVLDSLRMCHLYSSLSMLHFVRPCEIGMCVCACSCGLCVRWFTWANAMCGGICVVMCLMCLVPMHAL